MSASETAFLLLGLLAGLVLAGATSLWMARRRLAERPSPASVPIRTMR